MVINLKRDQEGRALFATLRTTKPPTMEIQLSITLCSEDHAANSLTQVARMLEHLRFSEVVSCDCAECVQHQVRAIMSYCRLASCDVSASILHRDQESTVNHTFNYVSKARSASSARTGASLRLL